MKSLLQEKKTNHKKVINHGMNLNQMVEKKKYVKDPMLNDILNFHIP